MSTQPNSMLRFAATWGLQCFGTLLLLAAACWWLTWPDEHAWQVAASAVMAVLLLVVLVVIERTIFAAHHEPSADVWPQFSLSACAAFALWIAVFVLLEAPLLRFQGDVERIAVRLAQVLHTAPRATNTVLEWFASALIWLVLPAILLPVGSLLAHSGFAALRPRPIADALSRALRNPAYWLCLVLALAVGVCAPGRLVQWIPERHGLSGEAWSAGLRVAVAYLLAITGLVFAAWITAWALARPQNAKTSVSS